MKKVAFVIFVLFSISNVFASNIAVISIENILRDSTTFKKLNDSLEKEKNSYQSKIKQKEIELNAKKDDIDSKSSILSQETLQKKILEFQKEVLSFQEEIKNKENELQSKLSYGLSKLNTEVDIIVKEMMKEEKYKGYSIVMNSSVLLYYNEKDDLTLEVLKRLNKKNISLVKNADKGK
ncbi:MAG: OmpH family outer membrane protein [Rickettsiales bacterium]|jgi:outer membrane protein|nr:OmpH family outer membrane protein [Rickettsiales bacterium]